MSRENSGEIIFTRIRVNVHRRVCLWLPRTRERRDRKPTFSNTVSGPFLKSLRNQRARKVVVIIPDKCFNSFSDNTIKLLVNKTK